MHLFTRATQRGKVNACRSHRTLRSDRVRACPLELVAMRILGCLIGAAMVASFIELMILRRKARAERRRALEPQPPL
jgi:hypothetical protein